MLRYVLAILLLAANCFAQDTARMDEVVQSYVSSGQFMGSVLVAQDQDVLFSKGYGSANLEWNIPNSPTTKFRLGSITKQFTAAAVLLLEEQGKLKIEDPIKKYLPDSPATWDKITIYHLLTHTSGIPSITNLPEFRKLEPFPLTPEENMSYVRDKPLEFAPGGNFNYSNSGYVLLGVLIEKVSGQTYQEFLKENIFTPLGMKDSGYDSNSDIIQQRASGYSPGPDGPINSGFVHMSTPFSAGALYSTTEDLLRWESALFGGKLLSPASLAKMTTPFKNNYALGVGINMVNGRKQISHGGGINGFNTFLAYYPETKITVAALGNLNGSAPQMIAGKLAALAHGETVELPLEKKEISVSPDILNQYVGTYQLAPNMDLTVTLEGDHLMAQPTGQGKLTVYAMSETKFFLKMVDATIEFFKDDKGAVSHLMLYQGRSESAARRTGYKKEPAPIDGTWVATTNGPDGNPIEVTYKLEGLGKTLIGTVSTRLGSGPFSEGKINGNKISFVANTGQSIIETTGTVSGDEIRFSQQNGDDVKQFTAKRVSE
jgi:CubicO group peptidase (beta-lactamase class C family)